MPLFCVLATDKPGSLALRLSTRPRHLAYVEAIGERLKLAGPFVNAEGEMTGSMLLFEAADLDAAKAFAAADPYAEAGLFASVEVKAWRRGLGAWGG